MKKIILSLVLIFVTFGVFSQAYSPRDQAILNLMNVKKGMVSVNTLADSMSKNMNSKAATDFKAEMTINKKELISTALTEFKTDFTAKEIDFIYKECTSDIIDYTDLTNSFFSKWRRIKGNVFFKRAKETYSKYQ